MYMHKNFDRKLTRNEYNNLHNYIYCIFYNENRTLREIKTLLETSYCKGMMNLGLYSLEYDTVANIIINSYGRKNTRILDSKFCNYIRNKINDNHGTKKYYFLYNIQGERMKRLEDNHMIFRMYYIEKRYYSLENIYLRMLDELEEMNKSNIKMTNKIVLDSSIRHVNDLEGNKENTAKIKVENSLYIKERQEECRRNSPFLSEKEVYQRDLTIKYDREKRKISSRYESGGVSYSRYKEELKELYDYYKITGCFEYYKK